MNDTVPIYRLNIWPCIGVIVMVLLCVLAFWGAFAFTSCTQPLFHDVPAFGIDATKTRKTISNGPNIKIGLNE